jgi:hypothetical protein
VVEIFDVGAQCLLDPFANLLTTLTRRNDAGQVWKIGAPRAVLGLFVDDDVFAQRSVSSPLARRMLPSVPTGTVSPSLPARVLCFLATGRDYAYQVFPKRRSLPTSRTP